MKHLKRCTATLLCSALLLGALPASAAGSQFDLGTNPWYPGINACIQCGIPSCTGNSCNAPLCSLCGGSECGDICQSVFWTAAPVIETPAATSAPCTQPIVTPAPVVTPVPTMIPAPEATKVPSQSMGDYTTESLSAQEQKAWNLLNQDRLNAGLSPLPLDPQLSAIARLKSQDMYEQNYFAHTSPTYGSASDMLRSFGYAFSAVGENIAHHATVEKSQAAFMTSDGHRRNILGTGWTRVGVGVWTDDHGYVYLTQLFAR